MLVTFKTKAHADITMFGNIAIELLKLAGMTGNVPTAILADDVPDKLATLERALGAHRDALGDSAPASSEAKHASDPHDEAVTAPSVAAHPRAASSRVAARRGRGTYRRGGRGETLGPFLPRGVRQPISFRPATDAPTGFLLHNSSASSASGGIRQCRASICSSLSSALRSPVLRALTIVRRDCSTATARSR